jgi:O-antigen/teichoic acid export membrane protein
LSGIRRNLLSVYTVNAVNGVLGVIAVPLGVALLGVEGYGLFSIYGVLASYIALVDLGVTKNFVRMLASDRLPDAQGRNLQAALGLYILIAAGLLALLPLLLVVVPRFLFPVPEGSGAALKWIVILAAAEYAAGVPSSLMQMFCIANERFDRYAKFVFVSGLCRYGLMFFGIVAFRSPEVVVGFVAGRRLIDAFAARWLMGSLPAQAWRPRFDLAEFRSLIGNSAALSAAQVLQTTTIALGSFLVNRHFGLVGLGTYRAAFDLASKVWFFSNGIGVVAFPRFAQMLSLPEERGRLFARFSGFLGASWAGYNLFGAVGVLAAPSIMVFLGMAHTPAAADLMVLMVLGLSLNAHSNLSYEFLQAAGKYGLVAVLGAAALAVMAGGFYLLYGRAGVAAMGWAWIASQALYAAVADAMAAAVSVLAVRAQLELLAFKTVILAGSLAMVGVHFGVLPPGARAVSLAVVSAGLAWAGVQSWREHEAAVKGEYV